MPESPKKPLLTHSVISMPASRRGPLWHSLAHDSLERLRLDLDAFLQKLDDELFDMSAVQGQSPSTTNAFFESMRALRKQKEKVVEGTLNQVGEAWSRCEQGLTSPHSRMTEEDRQKDLTLLENEVLEEDLAVDAAARHVEPMVKHEIDALRHRLAVLRGGVEPKDVEVPVAPDMILTAFQIGLSSVEVLTTEVRIVIYKLFDRHVLSNIVDLYKSMNKKMIGAGILPDWKPVLPAIVHNPDGSSSVSHSSPSDNANASMSDPTLGPNINPNINVTSSHLQLIDQWDKGVVPEEVDSRMLWGVIRHLLTPTRSSSEPSGPEISKEALLSAVSWVRQVHVNGNVLASGHEGLSPADQLKAELRSVIAAQDETESTPQSLGHHEDVIDMVAMLFDYVSRDGVLPIKLQAALSRMQLPYLRVALLEPEMFAQTKHPARQLLNMLADAGKGDTEGNLSNPVQEKIYSIVETIVSDHTPTSAMFEKIIREFDAFLKEAGRRTSIRERRLAESSSGQERYADALRSVAVHVMPLVREEDMLPAWLRLLLLRPWAKALSLIHLQEGVDSPNFKSALGLMNAFKVLSRSKPSPELTERLNAQWPAMNKVWVSMLNRALLTEKEVKNWSFALHRWLLSRVTVAKLPEAPVELAPTHLTETAEALIEVPLPMNPQPAPRDFPDAPKDLPVSKPALDDKASSLEVGAWVEFVGPPSQRGKLLYVSSFTHRLIFVSSLGTKLCDISHEEFNKDFKNNKVHILPKTALFDRALGSIIKNLRGTRSENNDTPLETTPAPPPPG